jgi:hypothetical protein
LLTLGGAYTVQILVVARSRMAPETGGGFAVAAVGLSVRLVAEMPSFFARHATDSFALGPHAHLLTLGSVLGFVAFAFGLTSVVMACVTERGARCDRPDAARIREARGVERAQAQRVFE